MSQLSLASGREQDEQNLQTAQQLGVIDGYSLDLAEAVQGADCVVIATPVASIESIFAQLQPLWSDEVILPMLAALKAVLLRLHKKFSGQCRIIWFRRIRLPVRSRAV